MFTCSGTGRIERVLGRVKKDITELGVGIAEVNKIINENNQKVMEKEKEFLTLQIDMNDKNEILEVSSKKALNMKTNLEKLFVSQD